MATQKQIEANRQNAMLGGVRSEEGKEKSRLNAINHGFFSHIVIESDKLSHEEFCTEIYEYFNPDNIFEKQLIEIVLSNILAYRRICLVESELTNKALSEKPFDYFTFNKSYETQIENNLMDELLKFQRYKTSAYNLITRAKHELERLQGTQKENP